MGSFVPRKYEFGGPVIAGNEYAHGAWCSGSRRHPRTLGNTCSCHSSDIWYRRLGISRDGVNARRTLWVSTCSGCGVRREFPYIMEAIPRETFCAKCGLWSQVEEFSWDGPDFAKLLPVFERGINAKV